MTVFDPFFVPDPAKAMDIDREVRRRLAVALRHVADRSEGQVAFDADRIAALTAALDEGMLLRPAVFGLYNALVAAVRRDDMVEVTAAWARLAEEPLVPTTPATLRVLGQDDFTDWETALFTSAVRNEGDTDLLITTPSEEEADAGRQAVAAALGLLDAADRTIADEIRALTCEFVLAVPTPESEINFGGVSTFLVWGALFLNPRHHLAPLEAAQSIAHESAHTLLHGFSVDDPLVENAPEARYQSPLRPDPRPMDGIYHATWVSARMHFAAARLAGLENLQDRHRDSLAQDLETHARAFSAGREIVRRDGQLTVRGDALMAAAEAYMDAA